MAESVLYGTRLQFFLFKDDLDSSLHPENDAYIERIAVDMEERLHALIDAGLDPNHVFDDENPIWNFQYITEEHCLNARLLRILLEHGGNPNINPGEDEWDDLNIYEYVDIAVFHNEEGIDRAIPYLLMLTAFGGKSRNGRCYFVMTGEHRIEELKEIEQLVWDCDSTTIHKVEDKLFSNQIEIHFYNRETNEEIAYYD